MGPKKKRKDEPPPEMGEGSKISALPQFVARHLEVKDERTGALRIWFASNNLKVCVYRLLSYCVDKACAALDYLSDMLLYLLGSNLPMYATSAIKGGHTLVIYVLY